MPTPCMPRSPRPAPYADLTRAAFDACLEFCATGGYALRAYDRWQRLQQRPDGLWQLRDPRAAQRIRMNLGTIQDSDTLKVRLKRNRGGKPLGEVEEAFAASLTPGDTFLIGGQIVRYEGLRETVVEVTRRADKKPKVATFSGTKFATSTQLSDRILRMFAQPDWPQLPEHTGEWLDLQRRMSRLPRRDRLLIESFPNDGRENLCVYGFAGRNAQQTLGLLLTKRMEETGLAPLGFVATDYATLIWGLDAVTDPSPLFQIEALRDGLDNWLAGNAVMKRTFRASATIAGLIERNTGGQRKSGRQATFSSDILYDTLLKYDPDHLLMQITREEAMRGLVDFGRIEAMIARNRRPDRPDPAGSGITAGGAVAARGGKGSGQGRGRRAAAGRRKRPFVARGRPGTRLKKRLANHALTGKERTMNSLEFSFAGARLRAMGSGALWWPAHDLLCVSDLHLGKSSRVVRRGGPALPPYDNRETLSRLAADLDTTGAKTVVCLGDSFDDLEASETLSDSDRLEISALQAGRLWIWIEGNHDPGPVALSGTHLAEWSEDVLVFRHIAGTRRARRSFRPFSPQGPAQCAGPHDFAPRPSCSTGAG